jgi:hypothetical protein
MGEKEGTPRHLIAPMVLTRRTIQVMGYCGAGSDSG